MKQTSVNIFSNYRDYLRSLFPRTLGYLVSGELILKVSPRKVHNVLTFLKLHTQCQYKILIDICGIDYPEKKNDLSLYTVY